MTEKDHIFRCPCGSESFKLWRVDESDADGLSVFAFCSECGDAVGKMSGQTMAANGEDSK